MKPHELDQQLHDDVSSDDPRAAWQAFRSMAATDVDAAYEHHGVACRTGDDMLLFGASVYPDSAGGPDVLRLVFMREISTSTSDGEYVDSLRIRLRTDFALPADAHELTGELDGDGGTGASGAWLAAVEGHPAFRATIGAGLPARAVRASSDG